MIQEILKGDNSYKYVIMDEDAVIVRSDPWYAIPYKAGEPREVVKHALPYIKENEKIDQKHLAIRRIKFHSFTGVPSFKNETLQKREDLERLVIGRCS